MELGFSKIDWNEEGSSREKIYFFVILGLIVFAMLRVFWLPTLQGIKKKSKDLDNIKMQIQTLEKFINIDKQMITKTDAGKIKVANKQMQAILDRMSGDPQNIIAEVISEITITRFMGSVQLESLSFGSPQAQSGYTSVPVTLNVLGTFSALQNYLSRLEKLNFLFTVDNVEMEVSEGSGGVINAKLETKIYISGLEAPGASTAGKQKAKGKK